MNRNNLIAAVLVALSALSCSIKEDRGPCPCYLQVTLSDKETFSGPVRLGGWDGAPVFLETVERTSFEPFWGKKVRKGVFTLTAFRGLRDSEYGQHYVTIPPGKQSDSLYAYHEEVDATGETALARVSFRKQFATVFLDIRKTAAETAGYSFLVEGHTCGFDLLDFVPVQGTFRFEPEVPEGQAIVPFRLPRQVDNSLSLTLFRKDSRAFGVPLGEYISRLGYNWEATDLQDIYVAVDLVRETVSIGIADWEAGAVFQLIEI